MDARRYGISLRVLTSKRSERVRYGIEQKRNSTSTGNHVLFNSPLLTSKVVSIKE